MSSTAGGAVSSAGGVPVSRTVEMRIPAQPGYVSFVRVVVAAVAELQPSLDASRIDDLRVAVSEAATNAIQAHQRAGSAHPITVSCDRRDATMTVVVRDSGGGFDAGAVPEMPAPESPERLRHESGMGISIMRALVDDSSISPVASGTEVRLVIG